MSDFLLTEQPIWFIIFCIAAGFGYAVLLYRHDGKLKETKPALRKLMFGLRFVSVTIIAFLLLSPLVKNFSRTVEKPIILLVHDNSESLAMYSKSEYLKQFLELKNKLTERYEIRLLTFGDRVSDSSKIDFSDKQTDISELMSDVQSRYFNRNVGAVVLASDGIFNKGMNPAYAAADFTFPVYTVALGDTSVRQDAVISAVNHNKIAFLNNEFPVQVIIAAKKMKGKSAKLQIFEDGKSIMNQLISYNSDDFFTKVNFILKAEKSGVRKFIVNLEYLDGELSSQNNKKEILVEVIDSKQKILILSDFPHPDIAAIRRALQTNANFETNYFSTKMFKGNVNDYDMVVLYQLPSVTNSAANILQTINKLGTPTLHILGTKSRVAEFNKLGVGVSVQHVANSYDAAQGQLNQNFKLFELNPNIQSLFLSAPPLQVPFGETVAVSGSEILAYQRLKNIPTEKPLIIINSGESSGKPKSAVILGEGLWQWAMQDYKQNQNQTLFNELINKTVQFLTLKADKDRFRVTCPKLVAENQEIKVSAERYNKSYEPITDDVVTFALIDSAKVEYKYEFSKSGSAYRLDLGTFPPGTYTWTAETTIDGKKESKKGELSVAEINIESENITANHAVLKTIAKETGAYMFAERNVSAVYDSIVNNPNIKPVSFSEKKTESLLNSWILFALILILLTAEWFLRKYHGTI